MTRDLTRLLAPRSVALIGTASWCREVVANLRSMGFVWDIWPVVAGEAMVDGVRAFASIERLPSAPDVGFVGYDGAEAVAAVAALAKRGAGVAMCQGEADLSELSAAAGRMPLLGPRCNGIVDAANRAAIWSGPHGLRPVRRGVAIVTRSSSLAQSLSMQRRGLPIACLAMVAPGSAQTGLAVLAQTLLRDDRVTALGVQAEDMGDPEAFMELASVAERTGKPVVVLRAGDEPGAMALIARAGMARVRSAEAFLEALKILHVVGALPANALAAMACSGGATRLVAGLAAAQGLKFPPLSEVQRKALESDLGPEAVLDNPLDCRAAVGRPAPDLTRVFHEVMSGGAVMSLVVMDCPRDDRCSDDTWQSVTQAAAAARARVGMPMAIVSTLPEGMPEAHAESLIAQGLIPLAGLTAGLEALAACVALGGPVRHPAPLLLPAEPGAGDAVLDEAQAAAMLAAHGLELVPPDAEPQEPVLTLHLTAEPRYGYVLTLKRAGAAVSALLPLGEREAATLLGGLPGPLPQAVVPALLSVQDYVMAQQGTVSELALGFRAGARGSAQAGDLRVREAGRRA